MQNIIIDTYTAYLEKLKRITTSTKKVIKTEVISHQNGWNHNYETEREDYADSIEYMAEKYNIKAEEVYISVDGDCISVKAPIEQTKTKEEIEKEIIKTFNENAFRTIHMVFIKLDEYDRKAYNHNIYNSFFKNQTIYDTFINKEYDKLTEYFSTVFVLKT